jgi:hypothetical protein
MTRVTTTVRWAGATALVLAVASSATAQQATGSAGASAQVGFERRPQLSPQEELAQADVILRRMDQAAASARRQLETARSARDVVRTLCLNDKLSQIDVATRSARDRQLALTAAVQRNDGELANHEFTVLTVLRQRAEQLTAEANQCIGEEMAFTGQTQIVTDINPNLPDDTTEFPPPDAPFILPPPPCTSCRR